jgi:hypothetical protein
VVTAAFILVPGFEDHHSSRSMTTQG